jgi:hypothetical protein
MIITCRLAFIGNIWAVGIRDRDNPEVSEQGTPLTDPVGWLVFHSVKNSGAVWIGAGDITLGQVLSLASMPPEELVILGGDLSLAEAADELWLELETRREEAEQHEEARSQASAIVP